MRLSVLFAVAVALGLAACDSTSSTIPTFGDPYTVQRTPTPVLEGDSLRATVSYSGGCEEHSFEASSSLAGTEIWLKHDANGDSCEAFLTREVYLPVDTSRLATPPIRIYISRSETIELAIDSTHIGTPSE